MVELALSMLTRVADEALEARLCDLAPAHADAGAHARAEALPAAAEGEHRRDGAVDNEFVPVPLVGVCDGVTLGVLPRLVDVDHKWLP